MGRGRIVWVAVVAVMAVMVLPRGVLAEAPAWCGTYELDEEASGELEQAFEPAIKELSRLRRPFARRKVRRQDGPDDELVIAVGDERITIQYGESNPLILPLDGEEVDYEHRNGDVARVRGEFANGALVTHSIREGVNYTATYQVSEQGELTVMLVLEIDRLPKEVEYRLVYRRRQ